MSRLPGWMKRGNPKVVVDVEKNRTRIQQGWKSHMKSVGIDHRGGMDQ